MSQPEIPSPTETTSEDRRRPRAMAIYVALWVVTVLCVIFALIVMLNQG